MRHAELRPKDGYYHLFMMRNLVVRRNSFYMVNQVESGFICFSVYKSNQNDFSEMWWTRAHSEFANMTIRMFDNTFTHNEAIEFAREMG